jgi:hypothetical protein
MENLKELLKKNQTIIFDNDRFCTENKCDDFRIAQCSFRNDSRNDFANGFKINFNGALFSFKRFDNFERKLNKLKQDWNLELNELETELINE